MKTQSELKFTKVPGQQSMYAVSIRAGVAPSIGTVWKCVEGWCSTSLDGAYVSQSYETRAAAANMLVLHVQDAAIKAKPDFDPRGCGDAVDVGLCGDVLENGVTALCNVCVKRPIVDSAEANVPTGYVHCACRDCMELTIGVDGVAFCDDCTDAECALDHECQRPDAYGGHSDDSDWCSRCEGSGTTVGTLKTVPHGHPLTGDGASASIEDETSAPIVATGYNNVTNRMEHTHADGSVTLPRAPLSYGHDDGCDCGECNRDEVRS